MSFCVLCSSPASEYLFFLQSRSSLFPIACCLHHFSLIIHRYHPVDRLLRFSMLGMSCSCCCCCKFHLFRPHPRCLCSCRWFVLLVGSRTAGVVLAFRLRCVWVAVWSMGLCELCGTVIRSVLVICSSVGLSVRRPLFLSACRSTFTESVSPRIDCVWSKCGR